MQSSWSNNSPGYQDRPDKAGATDHVYTRESPSGHESRSGKRGGIYLCRMWLAFDPVGNTGFICMWRILHRVGFRNYYLSKSESQQFTNKSSRHCKSTHCTARGWVQIPSPSLEELSQDWTPSSSEPHFSHLPKQITTPTSKHGCKFKEIMLGLSV